MGLFSRKPKESSPGGALRDTAFRVLDIETTGFDPSRGDGVCEIAWMIMRGSGEVLRHGPTKTASPAKVERTPRPVTDDDDNDRDSEAADMAWAEQVYNWTSLAGKFFHSFDKQGTVKWQGQVVGQVEGSYLVVRLFDWMVGAPGWGMRLVHISRIADEGWYLYETAEAMTDAWKYSGMQQWGRASEPDD